MEKLRKYIDLLEVYETQGGYYTYSEREELWFSIEKGFLEISKSTIYPKLRDLINQLLEIYNNEGYYDNGAILEKDSIMMGITDFLEN